MVYYHAFSADWVVRKQIVRYSFNHVSEWKFTYVFDFTASKNLEWLHQVHNPCNIIIAKCTVQTN